MICLIKCDLIKEGKNLVAYFISFDNTTLNQIEDFLALRFSLPNA